ncbi:hypothetical protein GCM10022209_23410 [Chitinophaga oryziterrae]
MKASSVTLNEELESAKKDGRSVVWYGDELKLNIERQAKENRVNIYKRASSVSVKLPEKIAPLDRVLVPENSVICNALPTTMRQLMEGGHPATAATLEAWRSYRADVEHITMQFGEQLQTMADIKKEMLEGKRDMVLLVAHLKGTELFIGDERISLDKIKAWGKRQTPSSGNRVAVLCVCNSGNQNYTVGSLFWKTHVNPLTNILKENGYFDMVIAPDHVILRPETTSFLENLLKNRSIQEIQQWFAGWGFWVFKD